MFITTFLSLSFPFLASNYNISRTSYDSYHLKGLFFSFSTQTSNSSIILYILNEKTPSRRLSSLFRSIVLFFGYSTKMVRVLLVLIASLAIFQVSKHKSFFIIKLSKGFSSLLNIYQILFHRVYLRALFRITMNITDWKRLINLRA